MEEWIEGGDDKPKTKYMIIGGSVAMVILILIIIIVAMATKKPKQLSYPNAQVASAIMTGAGIPTAPPPQHNAAGQPLMYQQPLSPPPAQEVMVAADPKEGDACVYTSHCQAAGNKKLFCENKQCVYKRRDWANICYLPSKCKGKCERKCT